MATRIAAVNLYALPVEHAYFALDAKSSDLSKRSCAVRTDIRGRAVVFDVSERARREGIAPGMTITEARARMPEIEVKDRDQAGELSRLYVLGELLFAFGPHVEVASPSFLFVDVGRADEAKVAEEIVRAMKRAGYAATVAIAGDPDTARTIAAHRAHEIRVRQRVKPTKKKPAPPELPPLVVVPPGHEISVLDQLPIEAVIWTDSLEDPDGILRERMRAIHASLRVLGIHDVAGLRALPPAQVASRFGEAGSILMQRAFAELHRPLRPYTPPDKIAEAHEVEGLLKRLFDRVEARLEARALSAGSISMTFEVEPDLSKAVAHDRARKSTSREKVELSITLARPSRRATTMLALAREKIGGALPGAVRAVSVEARSTAIDRGAQLDLFSTYAKKLEDVSELVGRLVAAFGEGAVFSPEIVDTHRPEAAW
jgi:protein ImuB